MNESDPQPRTRITENLRATYQLPHRDMMGAFGEAMNVVRRSPFYALAQHLSPELAEHVRQCMRARHPDTEDYRELSAAFPDVLCPPEKETECPNPILPPTPSS